MSSLRNHFVVPGGNIECYIILQIVLPLGPLALWDLSDLRDHWDLWDPWDSLDPLDPWDLWDRPALGPLGGKKTSRVTCRKT